MNTEQPQISIIVPVYNAEKYLHRCLDSILAQTFTDFELILVDDGSPDNSGKICDEYALKDSRIKVIHKENGGVALARQCGIDNAIGEFTIHVDPDDWVETNMLEELYQKACKEDADFVICNYFLDTQKDSNIISQRPTEENPKAILNDLLFHKLHGSLCNKLIKLSCYKNSNITFIENLNTSEDYLVCIKILKGEPKIAYLDKAFYHYYQNPTSITHQRNYKFYQMNKLLISELESFLGDEYNQVKAFHKAKIAQLCIRSNILSSKEFIKEFKTQYKYIWPHIKDYKMKLLFLLSIHGCKNLAYSFFIYYSKLIRIFK